MKEIRKYVINFLASLIIVLVVYFVSKYFLGFEQFSSKHLSIMTLLTFIYCSFFPFPKQSVKRYNGDK